MTQPPSAKSEPVEFFADVVAERDRLRETINEAAEMLSMTFCPYYKGGGTCDRGCHQEPACHVDQPMEGWEEGALNVLLRELVEEDEDG